mgnify:CR=1 FL=1
MPKKEAQFIREYLDQVIDKSTTWTYKIPDSKFTGKKPADVVGAKNGQAFIWEFKFHDSLSPFNYSCVTDLQVQSLKDKKKVGTEARVITGVKLLLSLTEAEELRLKNRRIQFVLDWDIDEFLKLKSLSKSYNIKGKVLEIYGRDRTR